MADAEGPPLDLPRIISTLDRHGVEHLIVGGVSAIAYGAERTTKDFDCLPQHSTENLERLSAALRELNARIRAEDLDDEEAKLLPVQIDPAMLRTMEVATWRTDAGDPTAAQLVAPRSQRTD